MQFGSFDDRHKEYVITSPDTPKPWTNYLGSPEYGGIITNNAGGYSLYRSGALGRFIRFRFNSVPADQPGRYIYFHDHGTRDFWSASWQPVGKPLSKFKSVCRHGTGYTVIESQYSGIRSEVAYFVPLGRSFEIWKVKVTNTSKKKRNLSAFTFLEYAGNWNAIDDLLNIQYVQYTTQMKVIDGIIDHGTNINIPSTPENFKEKDQGRHTFQGIVGAKVVGYDTDRETFLGPYRTYCDPIAVERGKCSNSLAYGDNPCGSLQVKLSLRPGQATEFAVIVGIGSAEKEGKQAVEEFHDIRKVDEEFAALKSFWHGRTDGFSAKTPDPELNATINMWGTYNCLTTYAWSRSSSLIYSGVDHDGFRYRDTVQDFLGVMHAIPDEARQRLELMITGQVSTGGAMPVVYPAGHNPGHETAPKEEDYRSDDALWLFSAIPAYVDETGDGDFYKKTLPYADKGADTVFGHMKRALQFSLERSGAHGLPCGLMADWNETLRFGRKGESIFVTMQLRYALKVYIDVALFLKKADESSWAKLTIERLDANIKRYAWDGEWFARGFRHDGVKFGSKDSHEGQIFLTPQVWSIISGLATRDQAETAMQQLRKRLFTKYGLAICDPPYTRTNPQIVSASLFNPGLKENGGISVQAQAWAVMAEAILGHGNQAYEYLRAYLPAAYNKKAEIREIEPYVVSQSTHSKESPKHGASRIPWLSGSASWSYYTITRYIIGIRPEINGIRIDPCVPSKWRAFDVERKFRGKTLSMHFENPKSVEKGLKKIVLNGEVMEGNLIPVTKMKDVNEVVVTMG
jgi:N,N'-diacetylchitobiose phosphorylase